MMSPIFILVHFFAEAGLSAKCAKIAPSKKFPTLQYTQFLLCDSKHVENAMRKCMCVHVCVCVYMCVCVHVCVHVCVCGTQLTYCAIPYMSG